MTIISNIPKNIVDAIALYESHITLLQIAYFNFIQDFKNDKKKNKISFYENFETSYKAAFNMENVITSSNFISYLESYILNTETKELEITYNLISNKIRTLLEFRRLRFNPKYPLCNSLFENATPYFALFAMNLGCEVDKDGNYKQPMNDFFTADNLFDRIANELNDTQKKVDELFILRKLNEKVSSYTQPQHIPQKQTQPINSTLHQQFLIFHYLFKYLGISTNVIDKTQIARFIQFATQKQMEAEKIQNTSIYKLVDNPFNGYKEDKGTTQTNLQKVRELFESIGLKQIAEIVNKDII